MISNATQKQVLEIVLKHLPLPKATQLFGELAQVPGNKSYRDSVDGILKILQEAQWIKL